MIRMLQICGDKFHIFSVGFSYCVKNHETPHGPRISKPTIDFLASVASFRQQIFPFKSLPIGWKYVNV